MKYKIEKDLDKDIIKHLKIAGWYTYKVNSDNVGHPDIIAHKDDITILIENKLPKKNCTIRKLFEKSQYSWFLNYYNAGNRNYFLLYYWKEKYMFFRMCPEQKELDIKIDFIHENNKYIKDIFLKDITNFLNKACALWKEE